MNTKKTRIKYQPPSLKKTEIELEYSIAASSTTVSPGGGGSNNHQPWITEEEVETIEKDWIFED
ncbi:hypothetical protein ORI89_02950 [Sphingobacterium sp. UT-1RO-CII-1]|uniref:hypothetical protein n=1 Tax=Sphingobacterium sp. UT-1RO-CII-1 TaxID=2995225 RepID=UPI00227B5858|nr:hypothetical protein [Sphingobacterium sp. UT-1RO-CII-1]MCY4778594.1 hypothetical protein [Sphingobacterium sp. UT-1RO-CII-1]